MHIAVCDDNIADRKQMERLLKRECDKRTFASDTFFTDSFGSVSALLINPTQYDVFYIDMCNTPGVTAQGIVTELIRLGADAPIVMCCSRIDYRQIAFPREVSFLDKPIKVQELAASLDQALAAKAKVVPRIEIRDDEETLYVREEDILYGLGAVGMQSSLYLALADGRWVHTITNVESFYDQMEQYPSFFFLRHPLSSVVCRFHAGTGSEDIKGSLMINGRHIVSIEKNKVTLVDGTTLILHGKMLQYAKYTFEEYHNV